MVDQECSNCGSSNFYRGNSEVYCRDCGCVIEDERIDTSKEYRSFNQSEKQSKERAEGVVTYTRDDKGVGGDVGNGSDLYDVSSSKRKKFYRMKKWDKRSQKTGDRDILRMTNNLVSALDLPDIVAEEAGRLCSKAREDNVVKGRRLELVSASIVYLVSRNNDVPRTLDEISEQVDSDKRVLAKNYRYIAREMDLGIEPLDPKKLLPRFANELDISGEVIADIRRVICRARDEKLIVGRKPASVVSGAIYYVVDLHDLDITQMDVALTCNVTAVTVRKLTQIYDDNLCLNEKEVSVKNVNA